MGQMIPINLPADGNWPTIVGDSIMIIGPRQNELTEEQRYFNPIYLMTYPGKEHLKAQMIRAGACDCDLTKPNRRIGVFSVAPDKQVSFSQGNLQYLPAINLWKFANTQYEYLGNANKYIRPTFRNWVDLFGWSANNATAPFGVSTSTNAADYAGDFVDWGTNTICGDAPGTWRTLSAEEWIYLLQSRMNANQLWALGQVGDVNGLILLPDNWNAIEELHFSPNEIPLQNDNHYEDSSKNNHCSKNQYNLEDWRKMELEGAVFLPLAAYREGIEWYNQQSCSYNTSTPAGATQCYFLRIYPYDVSLAHLYDRFRGRAVRLVHDTIVPKPEPEYVDLGLSVKWATFNVGATSPEDYGDYFAWGETETKDKYSWATYKWCDGDYTKLNKYCTKEQYGIVDNQTILQLCDDAAHTKLGGNWRMPTMEECQELVNLCTWTWTTVNGINGHVITGPNGNTIFLPATGAITTSGLQNAGESGYYWINSISTTSPYNANDIYNQTSTYGINAFSRYIGRPIRPVYDDRPPKRIGVFSVAADKQVSFSQGNLQYIQSTDTWQFANNQLEYMGHKHYRNGQLADTIEYFGWSGKNSKTPWGISLSTESSDYAGEFLDWGTNTIAGDAPNTWRTLSNDEWLYICQGRKNADQLLGLGTIGTVTGLIILPDDWQLPAGLSFTPNTDNATKNQYTYNQWAELENAGAVFIATNGYFNPKLGGMRHVGGEGHIRTNALSDNGLQVYSVIKTNKIIYSYSGTQEQNLQYAFAQRLVHDTVPVLPEPEYVDLGLSVKWATFNVGATSPEDYGNYFAWGETEPKETYSWATYKWCDGTASNITKYNTADGKTILEPADDAAQVHWGGKWRMPTKAECQELIDSCTWEWTTSNNINGYRVTGPNGHSIFLPAGGVRINDVSYAIDEFGYYWSSSLMIDSISEARSIVFTPTSNSCDSDWLYRGRKIRPVYDDRVE